MMGKKKGEFGYIRHMRKAMLLHTVILFLIAFFIFFTGKTRYSEYSTMFSITAIVVCIPGSMRMVSFIMFMIHRGGETAFFEKCQRIPARYLFFDSVITTTGESIDVYAFGIFEVSVIGFCPDGKADLKKLEKHLREMFERNDLKTVGIKIFKDEDRFLNRASELAAHKNEDQTKCERIRCLIGNLSL